MIGGLVGVVLLFLGWIVVIGEIYVYVLFLVLIIFIWMLLYFWVFVIYREKDYVKVKVFMLLVIYGVLFMKMLVLLYIVLLGLVCLLFYFIGMSDFIYLIGLSVFNIGFLYYVLKLKFDVEL